MVAVKPVSFTAGNFEQFLTGKLSWLFILASPPWIIGLSPAPDTTLKGQWLMSCWRLGSENLRPIRRFASKTVLMGFIATCISEPKVDTNRPAHWLRREERRALIHTWFLAASPIRRSVSVNATYEGVVRFPCSLGIISTRSCCHMPTQLHRITESGIEIFRGVWIKTKGLGYAFASPPVRGAQINTNSRSVLRHTGDSERSEFMKKT